MAGNWMDDRERRIRERDARGLGDDRSGAYGASGGEDRSWDRDQRRASGGYGGSAARGWQDPDYEGVSPAMREGAYGQGRRFANQDYTRSEGGGRFYGDDDRERIYREEYGEGGFETPRRPTRERYHAEGYGRPGFGGYPGETYRRDFGRPASGGTGGYDYERGYGDGGRRESRGDRFEDAGRGAGEFLHRAGQKVASWFNAGGEGRIYDPDYLDPNHGKRGLGPQGYKRSDERISDDAHDRLTDDSWLDATHISISVPAGEVTLSGTVESREAKHRAERLVEDLPGVNHVQNNLRVAKGNFLTRPTSGYGDSAMDAQMRRDDPTANGQSSSAGKKN